MRKKVRSNIQKIAVTASKRSKKVKWIIGIDEVGRGPVAGPVTVCAFAGMKVEVKKTGETQALSRLESRIGVYGEGMGEEH